ncbi:HNH endonuclease [Pseudogemmobacter sonorensis]|uniref:HNH endonuclease n=1 Tax=Pseudogemmobacter sonorensis TaxID=2989681 RepID=UPI003691C3AB
MTRRSISRTERVRIFDGAQGRCHICGEKIDGTYEAWDVEHVIPLELGGDDHGDNLQPAHRRCHAEKTKGDVRQIAKAKRVRANHIGARPRPKKPIPYRLFDGTPVYPR